MNKSNFLKTLLIPLASSSAFAKITVTPTNGGYTVQSCDNYKEKSIVGFKIGENGIEQFELAKNSCATKTYSPGVIKAGNVIFVANEKEGKKDQAVIGASSSAPGSSSTETSNNEFGPIKLSARLVDDATVEITGCNPNFKATNPVSVTNRDSQGRRVSKMADIKKVNGESCFVVQFKKGEINSGDEIGVGIYGVEKPIALSVGNLPWRTATTSPQPSTPPVPVTPIDPGNAGTDSSAPDTRINESRQRIQDEAQKAANRFADQMVKSMGKIENVRYNLFLGFRQAKNFYDRLGTDFSSLPEFNDGYTTGIRQGSESGRNAGRKYGVEAGQTLAQQDVSARFEQAMATREQPSNSPRQNLNTNSFAGLTPNLQSPTPIGERLKQEDQDLQRDLRSVTIFEDGIVLADSIFVNSYKVYDIYSLSDYKSDLLLSNYRAEKAFDAWKDNLFNERESAFAYYNDIGRTSVYQHAEANRLNFAADFIEHYDKIITAKWNNVVTRPYPRVQDMGQQLYVKHLKAYAFDSGKNAGFVYSYQKASRDGYSETLESSYRNSFTSIYNNYATSAVITDVVIEARPSALDGSLTLGDAIFITLKSATNRGMANGEIHMSASAQGSVGVTRASVNLPIAALTRIQQSQSVSMLYVSKLQSVDSQVNFSVQVENRNYNFSLRTSLESLVKRLGRSTDSNQRAYLTNLLVKTLSAEWNDKSSFLGNGFNKAKGDLYLERFISTYKGLTASEKSFVNVNKEQIKKAYGDKPGFFSGQRDDYASVMDLLSSIGF